MPLRKGDDGRLHFDAAAPGQVAGQTVSGAIAPRADTASGNPNFDPASGRFAGPNTDNSGTAGLSTTPINQTAPEGIPGFNSVVNQYVGLITQNFADATSMAVYPSGDSSTVVLFDKNGGRLTAFPVPNQDATQAQIDKFTQEVANPAFDKAAAEHAASLTRSTVPAGVNPDDWAAHQDVIREAARSAESMDLGTANQFLANRGASDVPADQFLKDVREQQIDDLADILDHQLHGTLEQIKRSRTTVRVTAPAGWTKRVFAGLDDTEVIKLLSRLEGKGWDPADLTQHVIGRIQDPARKAKLEQLWGQPKPKSGKKAPKPSSKAVHAADAFEQSPEAVLHGLREPDEQPAPAAPINLGEEMAKIAGSMPQPVHNIYVTMPDQKPTRRRPVRDDNGIITEVIEEPVDA